MREFMNKKACLGNGLKGNNQVAKRRIVFRALYDETYCGPFASVKDFNIARLVAAELMVPDSSTIPVPTSRFFVNIVEAARGSVEDQAPIQSTGETVRQQNPIRQIVDADFLEVLTACPYSKYEIAAVRRDLNNREREPLAKSPNRQVEKGIFSSGPAF
jgi:hypothetical protein